MDSSIRQKIMEMAIPESVLFQSRIVNSRYPVLGSRMSEMRKLARSLAKEIDLTRQADDLYYEEILLRGLILAYQKGSILEKKELIEDYLARIDTWALTDSFCATFKIKHEEREALFATLAIYLDSDQEFTVRYAQIMLLSHFLKYDKNGQKLSRPKTLSLSDLNNDPANTYIEDILDLIDRKYPSYYSSMGAGWLLAEAFLFFPKRILTFFEKNNLDERTLQLAQDKIRQSRIPDKAVKDLILKLKNKANF